MHKTAKNIRLLLFSLTIAALCGSALFAQELNTQGVASSMGKITTVASDGPYDVLRNPSIMTTQKQDNGAVVGISRDAFSSFDASVDGDFDFEGTGMTISGIETEATFKRPLYLNGSIAYSRKITDTLFAGIAAKYNREEMNTKRGTTITIPASEQIPTGAQMYEAGSENETTDICGVTLSAAYKLLKNISLGIQINVEYEKIERKEENRSYTFGGEARSTTGTNSETLSPVIALGFLYRDGFQEAGALITSGKYSWQKIEYEYSHRDIDNTFKNYELDDAKLKKGKYVESPAIAAGYFIQFNSLIGAAVEAGVMLPLEYKEHSLSVLENERDYVEAEVTVKKKFTYMAKGGIKLDPVKDFTIALGGGYMLVINEENNEKVDAGYLQGRNNTDMKFNGYIGTLGMINKIMENSSIIFSIDMLYLDLDFTGEGKEEKNYPDDESVFKMKMGQDVKGLQINAGLAYMQYF